MITFTTGPFSNTTVGYDLAKKNRIDESELKDGGKLDIALRTPVFIYDILQFPGSLAPVIAHESQAAIIPCMTPGSVRAADLVEVSSDDGKPEWARNAADKVHGMLVFGRGRDNRRQLRSHYGPRMVQKRVHVDFKSANQTSVTVEAYTWVFRNQYRTRVDWNGSPLPSPWNDVGFMDWGTDDTTQTGCDEGTESSEDEEEIPNAEDVICIEIKQECDRNGAMD